MLTNQSIGYMDAPIPKGLDLKEEINRMRREKTPLSLLIIIRQVIFKI